MIPARCEVCAGRRGKLRCAARLGQLASEEIGAKRLRGRVRRVEHDQAVAAEDAFEKTAEGVGHAGAGGISRAKVGEKGVAESGLRENLFEFRDDGGVLLIQPDGRHRNRIPGRPRREADRFWRHLGVEHRTRTNFIPVVVFRFNPEDRHGGHVMFAPHVLGKLDSRQRLQNCVHRPAEESCLLAGHDGDGKRVGEL